jgi:hypothetical protein
VNDDRFITQPEPATPLDLLATHISSTEAYNVEGDVREVNILTFEPALSTSFDDPVPWDVMPTCMSDIPTQIYGSADFQSAIRQLCQDFVDLFCREVKSEPARFEPLKVDIDLNKWRISKNGSPPRPQSTEKMEETRSQIERMLELDLIEPSKSPYYSHVHLVRKPTGKWRFCIDFRSVREYRVANSEHRADARTDWFVEAEIIREVRYDIGVLSDGFRPEYCDATTFIYPGGVYRWKRIPMGWKSAGEHFQQQLAGVLNECELYMDDILPFADSEEEMLQRLCRLFTRFCEYNVTLG